MNSVVSRLMKIFGRNKNKYVENKNNHSIYILSSFYGLFEELLFWNTPWLSLCFIFILNVIFMVCVKQQINLLGFIFCLGAIIIIIDALETWLKYKHRTTFLRRLSDQNGIKLKKTIIKIQHWLEKKWKDFIYLHEKNHTKAFIVINIFLGIIFGIGKCVNGYLITYVLCMTLCVSYKIVYPVIKFLHNMQLEAESECEYESLLPNISEVDIKLLAIESEANQINDEKNSFDYWKPEDISLEDSSDTSENSSSLAANLSMEKVGILEKEVETSDSSEDEYIPLIQPKEQLQSTMEVKPISTWSNSAYNAFWNITGAMANIVKTESRDKKHVPRADSSDGFEIIDKSDFN